MSKEQKIHAIKAFQEGKGLPSFDCPVVIHEEGRYKVTRLGKEYFYSEEEFRALKFEKGAVIIPENGR
jgi:hypothetical protein